MAAVDVDAAGALTGPEAVDLVAELDQYVYLEQPEQFVGAKAGSSPKFGKP